MSAYQLSADGNSVPESTEPLLIFDLGDLGDNLAFNSWGDIKRMQVGEFQLWNWVESSRYGGVVGQAHSQFSSLLKRIVNETDTETEPQKIERGVERVKTLFQEYYCDQKILHSSSPQAKFILKLKDTKGPDAAVAAYYCLLGYNLPIHGHLDPTVIEGFFEAYLYERNIDWTAGSYQQVLDDLATKYKRNISDQEAKLEELEARNTALNNVFGDKLNERDSVLKKLETDHSDNFGRLIKEHEATMASIRDAYDKQMALQKPVEFWDQKKLEHEKASKKYGKRIYVAGSIAVLILSLLGWYTLKDVPQNQNPKHWQIGLFLIGVFFAVWIVRIFVRLYLSHLHLATDAAERVIMVQTFISMSREGTQFAPEDKTLIVQHLFRSVSDGLVRDDATPPTPMEAITKKLSS